MDVDDGGCAWPARSLEHWRCSVNEALILAAKPVLEVPMRPDGSGRDLRNRLRGQDRRGKQGTCPNPR